jgi:hypothetical protein
MKNNIELDFNFYVHPLEKISSVTVNIKDVETKDIPRQIDCLKYISEKITNKLIGFVENKLDKLNSIGEIYTQDKQSFGYNALYLALEKSKKMSDIFSNHEYTKKHTEIINNFSSIPFFCVSDKDFLDAYCFFREAEKNRQDEIKKLENCLRELKDAQKYQEGGYCCVYNGGYNEIFGEEK